MKNFINKLRKLSYRVYENGFGKLGGMFAFGGILLTACGVWQSGLVFLAISLGSFVLCAEKLLWEDKQVKLYDQQNAKNITVEDYEPTKQNQTEQVIETSNQTTTAKETNLEK